MPVSMSAGVATPELSEEKLAAARKWLEENRHHLDLYNDPALLGPSANSNANDDDDVAATAKRAKNGESYDDVSDDDDEEEDDDEEDDGGAAVKDFDGDAGEEVVYGSRLHTPPVVAKWRGKAMTIAIPRSSGLASGVVSPVTPRGLRAALGLSP